MKRSFAPAVGLMAWAVQFTVIYGFSAVACARGYARLAAFGIGVVPLVITLTTTAGALALTAWSLLVGLRRQQRISSSRAATDRFLAKATILISGFSLIVIAWHGLPALIVPVCSGCLSAAHRGRAAIGSRSRREQSARAHRACRDPRGSPNSGRSLWRSSTGSVVSVSRLERLCRMMSKSPSQS